MWVDNIIAIVAVGNNINIIYQSYTTSLKLFQCLSNFLPFGDKYVIITTHLLSDVKQLYSPMSKNNIQYYFSYIKYVLCYSILIFSASKYEKNKTTSGYILIQFRQSPYRRIWISRIDNQFLTFRLNPR